MQFKTRPFLFSKRFFTTSYGIRDGFIFAKKGPISTFFFGGEAPFCRKAPLNEIRIAVHQGWFVGNVNFETNKGSPTSVVWEGAWLPSSKARRVNDAIATLRKGPERLPEDRSGKVPGGIEHGEKVLEGELAHLGWTGKAGSIRAPEPLGVIKGRNPNKADDDFEEFDERDDVGIMEAWRFVEHREQELAAVEAEYANFEKAAGGLGKLLKPLYWGQKEQRLRHARDFLDGARISLARERERFQREVQEGKWDRRLRELPPIPAWAGGQPPEPLSPQEQTSAKLVEYYDEYFEAAKSGDDSKRIAAANHLRALRIEFSATLKAHNDPLLHLERKSAGKGPQG